MKPTLQSIVAGWLSYGWTKKAAVQAIVDTHLRHSTVVGNGNKAAKRAARIETAQWYDEYQQGLTEVDVDMLAAIYDRN